MGKRKKRQKMPKWLWQLPSNQLSYKEKHFLAFVWWCADKGCREWNWRLMKRFKVSRATIKRRIKKCEDLRLIKINFPRTKSRTLFRRPYFTKSVWITQINQNRKIPQAIKNLPVVAQK